MTPSVLVPLGDIPDAHGLTSWGRIDRLPDMEVIVLADSHLSRGFTTIGDQVLEAVAKADVVLHAGDITSRQALEELQSLAETYAVLGNNDHDLVGVLPESQLFELAGIRVALVHDSGTAKGRSARLHRRFPEADLVVFGHSHVPIDEPGVQGQVLFNPGSATQHRAQPHRTFGRLRLAHGRIEHRQIEVVI
jgi:putative phosphoesterase